MRLTIALIALLPMLTVSAQARRPNYGGVQKVICLRSGCQVNEHYEEQLKHLEKINAQPRYQGQ